MAPLKLNLPSTVVDEGPLKLDVPSTVLDSGPLTLDMPSDVVDSPNIFQRAGSAISDRASRFAQGFQPRDPSTAGSFTEQPNAIGKLREIPLETAAPFFSGAREGDIPIVSDIFAGTKGSVPKPIRPLTTGLGVGLDALIGGSKLAPVALQNIMGGNQGVSGTAQVKQALEGDDFFSTIAIKNRAEQAIPTMQAELESGKQPNMALLTAELAALGAGVDILEGAALTAGMKALSKLPKALKATAAPIKAFMQRKALAQGRQILGREAMGTSAEQLAAPRLPAPEVTAGQGFTMADEGASIAGRRAATEAAGPPAPRVQQTLLDAPAQPKLLEPPVGKPRAPLSKDVSGPIAGPGFVMEEPGAVAKTFVPKKGAPRQYGKGGLEPSVELNRRLNDAAREPMRKKVVEGAIERSTVGQRQFKALPAPKIPKKPQQGVIAGKGFVMEPSAQPLSIKRGAKQAQVKNIIEKSAVERTLTPRQRALKSAEARAKRARKLEKARIKRDIKRGNVPSSVPKKPVTVRGAKLKDKRGFAEAPFGKGKDLTPDQRAIQAAKAASKVRKEQVKALKQIKRAQKIKSTPVDPTVKVGGKKVKKAPKYLEFEREALKDAKIEMPTVVIKNGKEVLEGGTVINNIPIGKLLHRGEITTETAQMFAKGAKLQPSLLDKFIRVSDIERKGVKDTPKMLRIVNDFVSLDPAQRHALGGTNLRVGLRIMQSGRGTALDRLEQATAAAQDYLIMRNAIGANFRALGKPSNSPAYIRNLRKLLAESDIPEHMRKQTEGIIQHLQGKEELVSWFDIAHEVGINHMLGNVMTMKRNLFGNMIGVGMQPGDRFFSALTSLVLPKKLVKNSAGFREVAAELAGMVKALPTATREGFKFAIFGDAKNIISFLGLRLKQIRSKPGPATAKDIIKIKSIIQSMRKAAKEGRIDPSRLSEVRATGGQSFSATRKFGREFVVKHPKFSAAFDTLGAIANVPSRILVGTDKFFQTISKSGHVAAKKVRAAMELDPKNWKQRAKTIKLNKAQAEEAVEDSLQYVFRDRLEEDPALGKVFATIENAISNSRVLGIPIGKALFPFYKTGVKLKRYAWKHSPFGALEEVGKMFIKKGPSGAPRPTIRPLDAKEFGKAVNGSLALLGTYAYMKKNGARFIGVEKTKGGRAVNRMRNLEEVRIEWVNKKGEVTGTFPVNNLEPASTFALAAASYEAIKNKPSYVPIDDVLADQRNAFFKGVLQQSIYNNTNEINRALSDLFDAKVPVTAEGNLDIKSMNSGLLRFAQRFVSSRSTLSEGRVAKRTGKVLSTFNVVEKNLIIHDPKTFGEHIRSGIPTFRDDLPFPFSIPGKIQKKFPDLLTDKNIPARRDFTGEKALRSAPVTVKEMLSGGRKAKDDFVLSEMARLKYYPSDAPTFKTIEGVKTRLTEGERRAFLSRMEPAVKPFLRAVMELPRYKNAKSDAAQAAVLDKAFSAIRGFSSTITGVEALVRQIQSKKGIQQLITDTYKGRDPFRTNP